jgi:hypothetical protein
MASGLGGAAGASSPTATSVLNAAKAAIAKQTGVHLVVFSKSGSTSNTVTADLGSNVGTESIVSGTASATIRVTPDYGYLDGNSDGLTTIFGMTAAQAKKVGKGWISMKSGTSQYTDLKSGATVSAITGVLPAAKGTTLSTTASGGSRVYVLKWTTAATSTSSKVLNTLTISAVGSALPVQESASTSSGSGTTTFTKWGEHVQVGAPPANSTIAYSKVTG